MLFDIKRLFHPDMSHASAWIVAIDCDAAPSGNVSHEVDLSAVRVTFWET